MIKVTEEKKKRIQEVCGGRDREAIYQSFKWTSKAIKEGKCFKCGGEFTKSGCKSCGRKA